MIEMMKANPKVVTDINKWLHYYEGIAPSHMGLLHFRVWQLYDLLVGYIKVSGLKIIIGLPDNKSTSAETWHALLLLQAYCLTILAMHANLCTLLHTMTEY